MKNKPSTDENLFIDLLTFFLIIFALIHLGDIGRFIHDTIFGKSEDEQMEAEADEDIYDIYESSYEYPTLTKDYDYAHGYYYDFLTGDERLVYDELVESCETLTSNIAVTPVTTTQFINASDALRYDHPDFYWLHYGLSYTQDNDGIVYKASIPIPDNAPEMLEQLDAIADNLIPQLTCLGEYEAYRYLYDYIVDQATYGKAEGIDDQSATGVLVDHLGVCASYSDAFKFLCDRAGLFCVTVVGTGYDHDGLNGGPHAWNLIRIDGGYTWVDVTWGDNLIEQSSYYYDNPTRYEYLCVPDEIFMKRHEISPTLGNTSAGHFNTCYPNCYDERFCYFDMMGLSFSRYEEAQDYIVNTLAEGVPYLWMEFSSTEELNRALDILHSQQTIWSLVDAAGVWYPQYYYYIDYEFDTLVFEFVNT